MGTPVSKENEFLSNVWPDALEDFDNIKTCDKDDCDNDEIDVLSCTKAVVSNET